MQLSSRDFFFCYSERVSNFLSSQNIKYITKAIEPNSKRMYTLYLQNEELANGLELYKKLKQQ